MDMDFTDGTESKGLFARIKAERKLTLQHWRYRLLHWVFGVKIDHPDESPLAGFLYTHYCPLFHVTNLLALFLPFIALLKAIIWVCRVTGAGIGAACTVVKPLIPKKKVNQHKKELQYIYDSIKDDDYRDFEEFWNYRGNYIKAHTKDEAKVLFERILANYLKAVTEKAEREQRRYNTMVRLSRIGHFVFKTIYITALSAFAVLLGYLFIFHVIPASLELAVFLFKNITTVATYGGSTLFVVGTLTLATFYIYKSEWFGKFLNKSNDVLHADLTPDNGVVKQVARRTGQTVVGFWDGCSDFISTLYEEHCPPVTILTGDEAVIEDLVQEN
jgi:hypothetical protein